MPEPTAAASTRASHAMISLGEMLVRPAPQNDRSRSVHGIVESGAIGEAEVLVGKLARDVSTLASNAGALRDDWYGRRPMRHRHGLSCIRPVAIRSTSTGRNN